MKSRTKILNEARHTAAHEAGHAVVGRALGMLCGQATIVADHDSAGHSITDDPHVIQSHWDRRGRWLDMPVVMRARTITFMAGAEAEIEDVLGPAADEDALDLVARVRAVIVSDLAEHKLPTSLQDMHARFVMKRESEIDEPKIDDALFRDLTVLMQTAVVFVPATPAGPSGLVDRVRAVLEADPGRSDRSIAKAVGCSPTTVGDARRGLMLAQAPRSVQRGEHTYRLKMGGVH